MTMLDYWQLRRNPFAPHGQREDLFLGGRCEEALARLLFVVEQGRRLAAVIGGPNSGKSRLLQEVGRTTELPNLTVVPIDASGLSRPAFALELAHSCGCQATSEQAAWERLTDLLYGWHAIGMASLWLLDHFDSGVEGLDHDVLRLLRLLERTEAKGTILVAARSLIDSSNWVDALDLTVVLEPWTYPECREFIEQRLEAAGAGRAAFTSDGLEALAEASGGVPGTLIRLGELALQAGWSLGANAIDAELVENVASELAPVTTLRSANDRVLAG